ncbi:hypothetical protein PHMEG_00029192 [Phytophthora megakarya]|uniref:Uncharacterized protein n=1 Tax=Phytophthora megakarya TaxID=4795 RepID=A0A225V3A0_9STRA|nr:hypothetical protein PHMEG_00029192 [Phytophthora megakarya]
MNVPLSKRRRTDYGSDCDSNASNPDRHQRTQRGIVFHPSPTDRRIHAAIVNRQHTGKEPQTLLQSVQQSPHVEFVASPATLRGLYSFGFGLGLSTMHCRRTYWDDEVLTSEKGANLSLSALHKFGQYFYNNETVEFISAAKDFIINYSDHARPDPAMARPLAYWINCKLRLFRSTILADGLSEATKVPAQFCRSDDKLAALRESSQSWKPLSTPVRLRTSDRDKGSRGQRAQMTSRIPSEVFSQLPKGEDGRRVCLKFLFKSGCQYANYLSSHFRPESLPKGARKIIEERWGGLSAQSTDLRHEHNAGVAISPRLQSCHEENEAKRHKLFMSTLHRVRDLHQATISEIHENNIAGLQPPPPRRNMLDEVDMNQVRFWSSVARDGTQTLPDIVRCLRGQTLSDPRPNKDLFEIATSVDPKLAPTICE